MSTSILIVIQQTMTRYVLPVTLALGNLGNLILFAVFSQRQYRLHSCSLYLLTAALLSIIGSNWAVVPLIYSADHPDPLAQSLVLCRARGYIIHVCAMSLRSMIVLASADRYALVSARQSIRAFSSLKIARRAIVCVPVFWAVVSVHLLIWVSIENNRCFVYGLYGQIYSIYQLICFGILPTILMIVFAILINTNLRQHRNRVHALTEQPINPSTAAFRQRDRKLLVLVVTEIVVSFICTFPYTVNTIYSVLASNITGKSIERLQIESFSIFITMWFLLYLKYSTTFYAYMITSKSFRTEVKTILKKTMTVVIERIR